MLRPIRIAFAIIVVVSLAGNGVARAGAQPPAEGGQKGEQGSQPVHAVLHPNPSKFLRLKMHWSCLKSGGKWKVLSDSTNVDQDKKTYSELKTWGCAPKPSAAR